jgi:CRP-like cAMP-binding protein
MEAHNPLQNYLLAAMPAQEFARLAPRLEPVSLPHGKVLYEFNEKLKYAYFPTTATASLLCTMEDGASVEVAEVGNEGVLDVSILLGGDGALTQGIIQTAGHGYRLPAKWLLQENDQLSSLQTLLMRYTHTLISQMAQTTGCIRRHSVEQQFCRWLLLNFDRMNSGKLSMTQELMANMLGVRRETVTEAAGRLQEAGLISYRRGQIAVLDRTGLESQACECYSVVKQSFDRLRSDLVSNRCHKHAHPTHTRTAHIHETHDTEEIAPINIIPRSTDRRRLNLYA